MSGSLCGALFSFSLQENLLPLRTHYAFLQRPHFPQAASAQWQGKTGALEPALPHPWGSPPSAQQRHSQSCSVFWDSSYPILPPFLLSQGSDLHRVQGLATSALSPFISPKHFPNKSLAHLLLFKHLLFRGPTLLNHWSAWTLITLHTPFIRYLKNWIDPPVYIWRPGIKFLT